MTTLKSHLVIAAFLFTTLKNYGSEVIIKKLSANIYDQLQQEGDGGIIQLKSIENNAFKYLNLQIQFAFKQKYKKDLIMGNSIYLEYV